MQTLNDVHQQFAEYFDVPELKPYAYLLSRKLSEGHICLYLDKIANLPGPLPAYCNNMLPGSGPLKAMPLVAKDGRDAAPFVLYQDRLYLQRYFRYETRFLQRLYQFLAAEKALLPERTALLQTQKA